MCITNTRSQTRLTGSDDNITIRAPTHYTKNHDFRRLSRLIPPILPGFQQDADGILFSFSLGLISGLFDHINPNHLDMTNKVLRVVLKTFN